VRSHCTAAERLPHHFRQGTAITDRTYRFAVVSLLAAIVGVSAWPSLRTRFAMESDRPTVTPPEASGTATTSSEPYEPCVVEAPPSARAAAQKWCEGGVFTKVSVSSDENNFVVLLQFSRQGQRSWSSGKYAILNRFRRVTDEIVKTADLNVALSLFDTSGILAGGCFRKRGEAESTCKAQ